MKLQQGQIWRRNGEYIHIVQVERLAVQYKVRKTLTSKEGTHHEVTKKEFCRLLKTADLMPSPNAPLRQTNASQSRTAERSK
jgi:hypothetical protein